mgnify:CR=1 FL=1
MPETLKKQIFQILCYALRNIKDSKDRRVRYLLPLRWMYEFCVEEGIDDIERLELEQIKKLAIVIPAYKGRFLKERSTQLQFRPIKMSSCYI